MTPDRESGLKRYSLGIVMEDKADGSDQIKVYPVEDLPFINGKISDFKQDISVSSQNAKGTAQKDTAKGDAVIVAKWFSPGNSNRMTPPDVIKNETVEIYRYADTDDYYWTTLFREPSIRRLETVCWMFGNLPSGLTPFDKISSYWFEVSTKNKSITLKTTNSNGEPYEYTVLFDTSAGNITIQDDIGNIIKFDSPSGEISATNSHGSKFGILGDDFFIDVPGQIRIKSGSSTTMQASDITATSEHNTLNGLLDVNGISNLNQGMNVTGNNGTGKTGTIHGDLQSTGSIEADGGMTAPVFIGHLNGSDND